MSILRSTLKQGKFSILLVLDFKKAFDTLEWPFFPIVLDLFNFGESVKRWTTTFYNDNEKNVEV